MFKLLFQKKRANSFTAMTGADTSFENNTSKEAQDDEQLKRSSSNALTRSASSSFTEEVVEEKPAVEMVDNGNSILINGEEQRTNGNRGGFFFAFFADRLFGGGRDILTGWTRRERILLSVASLNSVIVVILFSVCIALARKNQAAIPALSASVASDPDLYREICGDGNGTNNNGGVGTTTPAGMNSTNTPGSDTTDGGTIVVPDPLDESPPSDQDPVQGDPDSLCGCPTCTESVWNNLAGPFTCGDRILYLLENDPLRYPTQIHACRQIAFDHRCECGGCDPGRCSIPTPVFDLPENWVPPKGVSSSPAPTPIPKLTDPAISQENVDLYCFPPPGQRTEYTLWGGMVVQVKEDSVPCGPGDNIFTTQTVQVDTVADTLTLQYKQGQASEVRVLLPADQRPFTYGTYSFSVKSVEVKNTAGTVVSNVLPKELVLGLFTWDPMESYAVHENYNHEVDIEISRWDCETNSDLQFLVQPPGFPQMHRLFTGDPTATRDEKKYQQGGQVYEFTWNPAQIDWETTAGGAGDNSRFVLKTEEAVFREVDDFVQCLPDAGGDMEVRLNLWNMLGAQQPAGLSFATVEVVIDNFSFQPSGTTHLPEGSVCSKHCQCEKGVAECIDRVCTAV